MAFDILSFAIGKAAGGGAEEVETSVALDFSGGDMEVTPNEGEAFSKVTIPQPDTLVAENIAEGVTVAGIEGTHSGGGGGSLPAGVYVKPIFPQSPYAGVPQICEYQGKKYIAVSYETNTYLYDIDDTNFENPVTLANTGGYTAERIFLECNGKLHIFVAAENDHSVFDGETTTILNDSPGATQRRYLFVYNNKIYLIYSSSINYIWDEETDTWNVTESLMAKQGYYFVRNNELYKNYKQALYKYVDGSFVDEGKENLDLGSYDVWCFDENGNIYNMGFSTAAGIATLTYYDFETDTLTEKCQFIARSYRSLYLKNGRFYWFGDGSNYYKDHFALYEVTE